jgi:hypothetical protein
MLVTEWRAASQLNRGTQNHETKPSNSASPLSTPRPSPIIELKRPWLSLPLGEVGQFSRAEAG